MSCQNENDLIWHDLKWDNAISYGKGHNYVIPKLATYIITTKSATCELHV